MRRLVEAPHTRDQKRTLPATSSAPAGYWRLMPTAHTHTFNVWLGCRIVHGKCPNRLAFAGTNPLGLTNGNQNSRAACQWINWNDPYMYVINYTNVVGNSSSSAVYYTCQGINWWQPSWQCTTYQSAAATFSMCGSAAGGTFSSAPTSNLCTWYQGGSNPNWSTSAVTVVNWPGSYQRYKWTCQQYWMTCSSCTNPGTYEQQTCYARKQ